MSDFFKAYRARLVRNQEALINLIKEVRKADPTVEAYTGRNDRFICGVVFIKDEGINSIHFHEVPYRWSGCGYGEFNNYHHSGGENNSMPFTAKDVIDNFKPIKGMRKSQVEVFKDKAHYLKWSSWLQEFKEEDFIK